MKKFKYTLAADWKEDYDNSFDTGEQTDEI